MPRDFRYDDHGSIVSIQPLTPAAKEWIDENVAAEPWQFLGDNLCIEHRFADSVITGMHDAGLSSDPE